MSEPETTQQPFTCFKCGDGQTLMYCLNCAEELIFEDEVDQLKLELTQSHADGAVMRSHYEDALLKLERAGSNRQYDPSWIRPKLLNREQVNDDCIQAYHLHKALSTDAGRDLLARYREAVLVVEKCAVALRKFKSVRDPSLQIAAAKAMGWKQITLPSGFRAWKNPAGAVVGDFPPSLTLDLMWEAEEMLSDSQRCWFNANLFEICTGRNLSRAINDPKFIFQALHATSEQRAKAWLKVKGMSVEQTTKPQDTMTDK